VVRPLHHLSFLAVLCWPCVVLHLSECSALSRLVPRLILPEASLCGSLALSLACWHQGGSRASAAMQGAGANCALTMSPRPSQGPVRFGLGCP
jgi:hypothetical protein